MDTNSLAILILLGSFFIMTIPPQPFSLRRIGFVHKRQSPKTVFPETCVLQRAIACTDNVGEERTRHQGTRLQDDSHLPPHGCYVQIFQILMVIVNRTVLSMRLVISPLIRCEKNSIGRRNR